MSKTARESALRKETRMNTNLNDQKDIVSTILDRSRELDRMEKEIMDTTILLKGRIENIKKRPSEGTREFRIRVQTIGDCYWNVEMFEVFESYVVRRFTFVDPAPEKEQHIVWSSKQGSLKAEAIEQVRSHLPSLVRAMVKYFPGLLDPFMDGTEHTGSET